MTNDELRQHIAETKVLMTKALGSKEHDLLSNILSRVVEPNTLKSSERESLAEQLDSSAVDFEMDHPNIAKALREVGDTLSKMGV
jgi:hypothetical protein